jgi:hypothetical protein
VPNLKPKSNLLIRPPGWPPEGPCATSFPAGPFLGWVTGPENRQFYLRQLRDVKVSALVETYDAGMLTIYSKACGWVLTRAHAKAGDPWAVSGYLGKRDDFDEVMGKLALACADQADEDHAMLKAAVHTGNIDAQLEH